VGVQVINATEGGAWIHHTEEIALSRVIDLCPVRCPTPGQVLDRLLEGLSGEKPDRLMDAVRKAVDLLKGIMSQARGLHENGDGCNLIDDLVNREEVREMLQPFLRKSHTFVSRYAVSAEESGRLVLNDIISASGRLIPVMEKCLLELERFSAPPPHASV
jgi:hypothetical protein